MRLWSANGPRKLTGNNLQYEPIESYDDVTLDNQYNNDTYYGIKLKKNNE